MGLVYGNILMLLDAKRNGVRFEHTLTLGRQNLYLPAPQLQALQREFAFAYPAALEPGGYADDFLKATLSASQLTTLDYSDYEGCDIIHDMNLPIGDAYQERFDAVIDGGSLEHIFNFPVAIANCMKMVKVGGSFFCFTTANNYTGHGFYQFSPELFFRVFQPDNGFQVKAIVLHPHSYPSPALTDNRRFYSVTDPIVVHERVGLVTNTPVMIMVHAIKVKTVPVFAQPPIQSDYAAIYEQDAAANAAAKTASAPSTPSLKQRLLQVLPLGVQAMLKGYRERQHYGFSNRRFYTPWPPARSE